MKVNRAVSHSDRILRAADRLFYTRGIRAVGVDAVAEAAGVSKRTLYHHYPSKDALIAAYLTARFRQVPPSDAPAREQILGYFDRIAAMVADGSFRGCPYVNAVTEIGERNHAAVGIAIQFKEQRRQWYRALLERLQVKDPEALATQIQLLAEGAIATALVRGDPAAARAARDAAAVLIDASPKKSRAASR
ncbi:MAG TPA: helix-turn-helix domain-containing protein [Burkholderiales bacterium]|jgi:AcrR family transcriptional regulator|nr:helix-turn-helix domain-containing protein [Burkholderiales bacterium]